MKCLCGYNGDKDSWYKAYINSSDGHSNIIATRYKPREHVGSIGFYICPICGLVYSDVRGSINGFIL